MDSEKYTSTEIIHAFIMVRDITRTIEVKEELIKHYKTKCGPEFGIYVTAEEYNIEMLTATRVVSVAVLRNYISGLGEHITLDECEFIKQALPATEITEVCTFLFHHILDNSFDQAE